MSAPELPDGGLTGAAHVVAQLGDERFVQAVLEAVGGPLGASHCSILQLAPSGAACSLDAASLEGDGARLAGVEYVKAGFFAQDRAFADPRLPQAGSLLTLNGREDVPSSEYRRLCYERLGIDQRCSIVTRLDDGARVSINFYRSQARGAYSEGNLAMVQAFAPLLIQALKKHRNLQGARAGVWQAEQKQAAASELLLRLTAREREVALLCVRGCSAKDIARQLRIAPTTVNTLKQRAYQKLDVRRQSELVARLAGAGALRA